MCVQTGVQVGNGGSRRHRSGGKGSSRTPAQSQGPLPGQQLRAAGLVALGEMTGSHSKDGTGVRERQRHPSASKDTRPLVFHFRGLRFSLDMEERV